MAKVKRQRDLVLRPDSSRVFFRPFMPEREERVVKIIARVMELSDREVDRECARMSREFLDRTPGLRAFLLRRFEAIQDLLIAYL